MRSGDSDFPKAREGALALDKTSMTPGLRHALPDLLARLTQMRKRDEHLLTYPSPGWIDRGRGDD